MMIDRSVGRIYIDANVFMIAVEGNADSAQPAIDLLDALRRDPGAGITSEVSLLEILSKARRNGGSQLYRRYLDLLVFNDYFHLVPVSRSVLYAAIDFRHHVQLAASADEKNKHAIDAIHVGTAIHERCRVMLTGDKRI